MAKETFNLATQLENIGIRLEAIRAVATVAQYACEDTGGGLPPRESLMNLFFLLDGDLGQVIEELDGCMNEALHRDKHRKGVKE